MKIHSVAEHLPQPNTYVLARYAGGNWRDGDDQAGCVWQVVKFEPIAPGEYADGNNRRPYRWKEFGPGSYFGQDFDVWCDLPMREER